MTETNKSNMVLKLKAKRYWITTLSTTILLCLCIFRDLLFCYNNLQISQSCQQTP
uniref:Uncharacterized protein n=1 Tax=Anguilla anguilla TaxID=7936 RepID=A0A0E9Q9F1_ANGAN